MNKFFFNNIAKIVINKNLVIIANKFTGKWVKVPKECYDIIEYSSNNGIPIYETVDMFLDIGDKEYYYKVLKNLDSIGLLTSCTNKDFRYGYVPIISFAITNKCNLNCDYCCKDSNIESSEKLSIEDLKMIANKISNLKPINLTISGGEPLLRKDFKELIDYIKSIYDGKLILSTNATLINSEKAEYIAKNFDAVEISIDGYDEDTCSEVRGKGIFNKVIKSIEMLKGNRFNRIYLSMVVGKHNYKYKERFEQLNKELGTDPRIRYFCSLGRGADYNDKYLDEGTLFYTPSDEYKKYEQETLKTGHCNAGINQLHINHEGDIYLCPNLSDDKYKICNIIKLNSLQLERLYKRDYSAFEKFDYLNENHMESCRDCNINIFCNVCPSKTELLQNDKVAFDKNCKFIKENIYNKIW